MADSSFDIVSKIDRQEVDNALNQAAKELATRFDFRGTAASRPARLRGFVADFSHWALDLDAALAFALAQGAREVVEAYKDKQVDLIAKILSDGVAQGVFEMDDVKTTARAVFDALPFDVDVLYGELDGTFPNHPADPIQPENLVDLQARVLANGADVGLAFDGDGAALTVRLLATSSG